MTISKTLLVAGCIAAGALSCAHDGGTRTRDPADLVVVSGDGQFGLPGGAVPESLVVEVLDQHGQGLGSVPVTWTVSGGGGAVHPAATATDNSGRLAAAWVLGSVGSNSVEVATSELHRTISATATNTPPDHLAILSQPATGNSGAAFSPQPVVELRTPGDTPVPQAGVTITVVRASGSNFGSLSGATAVTGSNGRATFTGLTLTGPVGNYTLQFSAPGLPPVTGGSLALSSLSGRVPLTDMGNRLYLNQFSGGLYANGSNTMPAAHAAEGAARARAVRPLDGAGNPSAAGKIVLLSIGMSNATLEWCAFTGSSCSPWSFIGQAAADNAVDHANLVILDGAKSSQTAPLWDSPSDANYDRVRDSVLAPNGVTEAQVQVVWLKDANSQPTVSLPAAGADAFALLNSFADVLRAIHTRYPNIQMVFMTSRIFAGYATIALNPEPYAYETGFAMKWVIQAQIDQMANGGTIVDPRAGNLNYTTRAPWVAWGPYMWADGLNPRSDGLTWAMSEFQSDGTHPDVVGQTKMGTALLTFFKTDPHTACWFLSGQTCP